MAAKNKIAKASEIVDLVYEFEGEMIMLDSDLAKMYGVSTSRLNEQVKRNIKRFPGEFMKKISLEDYQNLKSQNATSSWGGKRKPANAFTSMGVFMLANVIKSDMAIRTSIQVIRGFVKFRALLSSPISRSEKKSFTDLVETLKELEQKKNQKGTLPQPIYITTGNQSPIIIGNNAMVQIGNKVKAGDLKSLKQELKTLGIAAADVTELGKILSAEPHLNSKGEYGRKTKSWVKKMMGKAVDGSWDIGIQVAGALLAQLLNGFFGL